MDFLEVGVCDHDVDVTVGVEVVFEPQHLLAGVPFGGGSIA